mmetsp:Transcript_24844/g.40890  ORF Transcript_24844/g.40890 Transcript_24844/m.40890 type:complete len:243 (+) Transcript_24844:773-1501(+)
MKEHNKAIEVNLETLPLFEKLYGAKSPKSAQILTCLGESYVDLGDLKNAFDVCSRALRINIDTEGHHSVATSSSLNVLAEVFGKSGRCDEAICIFLSALSSLSDRAPDVFAICTLHKIASLYLSLLMYDEADYYGKQTLDTIKSSGESDVYKTCAVIGCQGLMIEVYERKRLHREANALKKQGPYVPFSPTVSANICASCFQSKQDVGKDLMRCTVCRIVRYCSKDCQRQIGHGIRASARRP